MSSPEMCTVPSLGKSSPATKFSSVVLPDPERPISPTNSPCRICSDTSRTAQMSSEPTRKRRLTPRTSTISSPARDAAAPFAAAAASVIAAAARPRPQPA